ncbi:MAG: DUF6121 family protein [Cryobacterium sp.]|nr:DUF6121 family protein [Cryobacterium sp.]
MRDYQKYAITVALFAGALYVALIVASFGMISLFTNLDVIDDPAAGPLLGPSMVAAAAVLVLAAMVLLGIRIRPERQRVAVGNSLATGLAASGVFSIGGGIIYAVGNGQLSSVVTFAASMLLGPFAAATGVLAFIVTLIYSWMLAAHVGEGGRPLWPWERRGDE